MTAHVSTAVRVAALAIMAPALLLPMKANGQQKTLDGPNFAKCDAIKDPAESAQCTRDALRENLEKRNEAALNGIDQSRKQIQAAQVEGNCAEDISKMRADNPKATEIGRELVRASGRPAAEYNICRLRDGIRDGLAAKR